MLSFPSGLSFKQRNLGIDFHFLIEQFFTTLIEMNEGLGHHWNLSLHINIFVACFTPCKYSLLTSPGSTEKIPWWDVRSMIRGHLGDNFEIFYFRPLN